MKRTNKYSRTGSVLLAVMMLSAVLVAASAAMVMLTGNAAFRVRNIHHLAEAHALAEAGVNYAIVQMSASTNSWALWEDFTYTTNFPPGSFTVSTSPDTIVALRKKSRLITSTGRSAGAVRQVVAEILNDYTPNFSLLSGGDITISTAAPKIEGDIHANGSIFAGGGAENAEIDGEVSAHNTVDPIFNGTSNAPEEPIDDDRPFDPQKAAALAGGGGCCYHAGDLTVSGDDLVPCTGVLYVEGDLVIRNNSSVRGTMVAQGDVKIGQNFEHFTIPGAPFEHIAILAGQNVELGNLGNYTGIIFAGGDIDATNRQHPIAGSLVALGDISIANQVVLTEWDNPAITNKPSTTITAWLK